MQKKHIKSNIFNAIHCTQDYWHIIYYFQKIIFENEIFENAIFENGVFEWIKCSNPLNVQKWYLLIDNIF